MSLALRAVGRGQWQLQALQVVFARWLYRHELTNPWQSFKQAENGHASPTSLILAHLEMCNFKLMMKVQPAASIFPYIVIDTNTGQGLQVSPSFLPLPLFSQLKRGESGCLGLQQTMLPPLQAGMWNVLFSSCLDSINEGLGTIYPPAGQLFTWLWVGLTFSPSLVEVRFCVPDPQVAEGVLVRSMLSPEENTPSVLSCQGHLEVFRPGTVQNLHLLPFSSL